MLIKSATTANTPIDEVTRMQSFVLKDNILALGQASPNSWSNVSDVTVRGGRFYDHEGHANSDNVLCLVDLTYKFKGTDIHVQVSDHRFNRDMMVHGEPILLASTKPEFAFGLFFYNKVLLQHARNYYLLDSHIFPIIHDGQVKA